MPGSLTDRFKEVIELRWSQFLALEADPTQSNYDSIVTALIRACIRGNLRSIQEGLDRLDGKVVQEVDVQYPKFYTLYPNATRVATGAPALAEGPKQPAPVPSAEPEEPPTGSLRAVLERMLGSQKSVVEAILAHADLLDRQEPTGGDPYVKSVIVASLMRLVHGGKIAAVLEVFEQIDGKVKDTVKLLGDDVYLTSFAEVAPAGAELNADGVYQLENTNVTTLWTERLDAGRQLRG